MGIYDVNEDQCEATIDAEIQEKATATPSEAIQ